MAECAPGASSPMRRTLPPGCTRPTLRAPPSSGSRLSAGDLSVVHTTVKRSPDVTSSMAMTDLPSGLCPVTTRRTGGPGMLNLSCELAIEHGNVGVNALCIEPLCVRPEVELLDALRRR